MKKRGFWDRSLPIKIRHPRPSRKTYNMKLQLLLKYRIELLDTELPFYFGSVSLALCGRKDND